MPINRWRGDAPAKNKQLRITEPANVSGNNEVVLTIGNKTVRRFGWDAPSLANALNTSNIPELIGISAAAVISSYIEGATDIVLSGPLDTDFDVDISVSPYVAVSFEQGRSPVNQHTRINFGSATGGTFRLTCNAEQTAAINMKSGSALNVAGVATAIDALTAFDSADVTVTAVGSEIDIEWKDSYAAQPVSVSIDPTELNNGGSIVFREVQAARAATHDIWTMLSTGDFQYAISDGTTSVTLKTNATEAEMSAQLSAAWGGRVDVYSHLQGTDIIKDRYFVLDMVGFPGVTTTLTVASILPVESPLGIDIEKVFGANDATPEEIWLVDLREDQPVITINGVELDGIDTSNSAEVRNELNNQTQFTEWDVTAIFAGGATASSSFYFLQYISDNNRINSTHTGGEDYPEANISFSVDGAAHHLQHGGPTNAADSAIHEFYLQANNAGNTLSGTYRLEFSEGTTASISATDNAAAVQSAIATATGFTVAVTGNGTANAPFVVDYTGDANPRDLPTVAEKLFTGDGNGLATIAVQFQQALSAGAVVRVPTFADGGTYDLSVGTEGPVTFDWDDTSGEFLTRLQSFPQLSTAGDVAVSFDANTGEYFITWQNNFADQPVDAIQLRKSRLTSSTPSGSLKRIDQFPTGPRNFVEPLNWTLGRAPINGDEIVLDASETEIEYGFRLFNEIEIDTTTDTLTSPDGIDLIAGQTVRFKLGLVAPSGLSASQDYYLVNVNHAAKTFQVSLTVNGAAVDITAAGTGPHYCGIIAADILIPATFDSVIGLELENSDGYEEYRPQYLKIGIASDGQIEIGKGDGGGSGLLRIDTGNSSGQVSVYSTGQSQTTGAPAFVWDAFTDDGNLLIVDGEVGIAVYDNEVAKVGSFNVMSGSLFVGSATIVGNAIATAGTLTCQRMSINGLLRII